LVTAQSIANACLKTPVISKIRIIPVTGGRGVAVNDAAIPATAKVTGVAPESATTARGTVVY
jgi:hypothetical protein